MSTHLHFSVPTCSNMKTEMHVKTRCGQLEADAWSRDMNITNIEVNFEWKNSQIVNYLEQDYGDNTPMKIKIYKYRSCLRSERNMTKYDPRSGR